MKEISKIIKDETVFIDIANLLLNEFIKYNDLIKEKKFPQVQRMMKLKMNKIFMI